MEAVSHGGMRANEHITVRSISYKNVETLKYLSLLTNQNSAQEEIKY